MKKDGLIRIDEVGRIVLPKEMRKVLRLDKDRLVELYVERDKLIIKKYSPIKNEVERAACICERIAVEAERICFIADTSKIICVSGEALKDAEGKKISSALYSAIEKGAPVLINSDDGGKPFSMTEVPFVDYGSLALVVLENDGVPIGCIGLIGVGSDEKLGAFEMKLLNVAKGLIQSCV